MKGGVRPGSLHHEMRVVAPLEASGVAFAKIYRSRVEFASHGRVDPIEPRGQEGSSARCGGSEQATDPLPCHRFLSTTRTSSALGMREVDPETKELACSRVVTAGPQYSQQHHPPGVIRLRNPTVAWG